jgi:hypothetical protein
MNQYITKLQIITCNFINGINFDYYSPRYLKPLN